MPNNQRSIPAKDADFNVWQSIIAQAALENSDSWLLDTDWLNHQFVPAREAWNEAWTEYENPGTRTPLITAAKQEKRATYEKLLNVLAGNLRVNTRLTDDDRRSAGIVIRDRKPTPTPVPVTYPVATIDTSVIRRLTVHFRDSGSATAAKPYGVHGAEIKWLVADEKPTVEALTNSSFDTRSPYTLEFDDSHRAKTLWICLRWENTRGEKGPWGEMISAIIP